MLRLQIYANSSEVCIISRSKYVKICLFSTKTTELCITKSSFLLKNFCIVQFVYNFAPSNNTRMKKIFISVVLMALATVPAMAGGLNTNTNQNAAYVRQMSQNGIIDIAGMYANPAGTAFLSKGWHITVNSQSAFQKRNIETTFPLFALNSATPGQATHLFEGSASAPVIPSFSLSYNWERWSVNAHFGLVGGGGKCHFNDGLGSFEALYAGQLFQQIPAGVNALVGQQVGAMLPGMVQGQVEQGLLGMGVPAAYAGMIAGTTQTDYKVNSAMTSYGLNSYMSGRSYNFGLQVGGTYKITKNFSAFAGVRLVYATYNYNGYVKDVSADYQYAVDYTYNVPANAQLGFPGTSGKGQLSDKGTQNLPDNGLELDANQSGIGITPIIGIDWKAASWLNLAAKYEIPTKVILNNSTTMNAYAQQQIDGGNTTLGKFKDGAEVREDIPGILALGAMITPVEQLRMMMGFNYYFDKNCKSGVDGNYVSGAGLDDNTWEFNIGFEADLCKWLTASISWQNTTYGISDAGMNDLSFNLSNNMIGAGFRVKPCKLLSIDLGYMHTMYDDRTVVTPTAAGNKTDKYIRKNDVLGVGLNFNF